MGTRCSSSNLVSDTTYCWSTIFSHTLVQSPYPSHRQMAFLANTSCVPSSSLVYILLLIYIQVKVPATALLAGALEPPALERHCAYSCCSRLVLSWMHPKAASCNPKATSTLPPRFHDSTRTRVRRGL
jgi:hypothetical protein